MTLLIDTRDPWSHPWAARWPADAQVVRGTLETGDVALAALPEGAVLERKTVADFLACMGRERERFERELVHACYVGAFCVIVEGDLSDVILQARGMKQPAIMTTVATWMRRFCPILFAGGQYAADLTYRFLAGQVREVEHAVRVISRAAKLNPP